MTTASAKTKAGRPPKPAATKRSNWLKVRVTDLEKAMIEANAAEREMGFSEFVRLATTLGVDARGQRATGARAGGEKAQGGSPLASREAPGVDSEMEALIREYAKTMPRRNAETAARRAMTRRG